jgi:hypothetical protein
VSKRKRKLPGAGDHQLPLNSPNWWTYDKAVRYVRAQKGDKDIADVDLVTAIAKGDVPSKLEQVRMQYDPPARRSKLLTPEFYQRDYKFIQHWGRWMLAPRTDQRLLGSWDIYLWGPKIEKIWPAWAAATAPASPIMGTARRRPGPKVTADWRLVYAAAAHEFKGKHGRMPSAIELAQLCGGRLRYQPDETTIRKLLQYLVGE